MSVHAGYNRLFVLLLLAKLAEAVTRRFVEATLDRPYRLPGQDQATGISRELSQHLKQSARWVNEGQLAM